MCELIWSYILSLYNLSILWYFNVKQKLKKCLSTILAFNIKKSINWTINCLLINQENLLICKRQTNYLFEREKKNNMQFVTAYTYEKNVNWEKKN